MPNYNRELLFSQEARRGEMEVKCIKTHKKCEMVCYLTSNRRGTQTKGSYCKEDMAKDMGEDMGEDRADGDVMEE